jgi:hypothetical protein
MARNSIPFFGSTGRGSNPLDGEAMALLNACDDRPRGKPKRHAIKSADCKLHRHRACFTSPCNCPCHKAKPAGAFN